MLAVPAMAQFSPSERAARSERTQQDYKLTLQRLGLASLRGGVDGMHPDASNAVNYDETKVRTYKLTPGTAYLYNEGDLHSPRRDGDTRLIRIEGTDLTKVERDKFEIAACLRPYSGQSSLSLQLRYSGFESVR